MEEMKAVLTKMIDTLTQEDFDGALKKLLERYKCIAAGGDYFEGDKSFTCVLSIKVPIRKKSGNLSYVPSIYIYIYIKAYIQWVWRCITSSILILGKNFTLWFSTYMISIHNSIRCIDKKTF